MELKEKLQDYTRAQFAALVEKIHKVEGSKADHDRLILHFDQIIKHPLGSDLLFYPPPPDRYFGHDKADIVFYHVTKWYYENGQLAFKDDTLPKPRQKNDRPTPQPSAKDLAWKASSDSLAKVKEVENRVNEAKRNAEDAFVNLDALLNATDAEQKAQSLKPVNSKNTALLEETLSKLEVAQRSVTRGVHGYDFLTLTVQFAKDDAERSISYTGRNKELQATILQRMTHCSEQYLALKPTFKKRELELHLRTQALVNEVEAQLIRLVTATNAGPVKEINFFHSTMSDIDAMPRVLTTYSDIANAFDTVLPGLRYGIRSAASGLAWSAASEGEHAAQYAAVMAFRFDKPGLGEPFALSVPLSELVATEGRDWSYLAAIKAEVDLPFRMRSDVAKNRHGKLSQGLREINDLAHIYVVSTNTPTVASKVEVCSAIWDSASNGFRLVRSGQPTNEILWSAQSAARSSSDLPGRKRLSGPGYIGPISVPVVEAIPVIEDLYFDDCIVVFPESSGVEPVYVMFKAAREYAGAAHGNGQPVEDSWKQNCMSGSGSVIPSSIADKLKGQVFKRFSLFRESFWRAVAEDSTLHAQFSADDLAVMKQGRGPVIVQSLLPMAERLEVFHAMSPEDGGGVYDLDNMRVGVRPKAGMSA